MTKENITKWTQWGISMLLGIILSSGAWILRQDRAAAVDITKLQSQVEQLAADVQANSAKNEILQDNYTELLKLTAALNAKVDILLDRSDQ